MHGLKEKKKKRVNSVVNSRGYVSMVKYRPTVRGKPIQIARSISALPVIFICAVIAYIIVAFV